MGNLLNLLSDRPVNPKYDVFLDFENAKPTESEQIVHGQVAEVLKRAREIEEKLKCYQGAGEPIRQAISNPKSEDLQMNAWQVVCPLVAQLKEFYEYSLQLERVLVLLLDALTTSDMTPVQHLEMQQALVKQFAEILHFTLTFDDLKMTIPSIQNDFSYYRRTMTRIQIERDGSEISDAGVSTEMANRMSLFYASPTPMLKTLSDVTSKFVTEHGDLQFENTTECLGTMATLCKLMVENPEYRERLGSEQSQLFCLRVMVGVIILYDHVHPAGAFARKAAVDVRSSIKVLKDHPHQSNVEGLLNALRYSTKHLNDEATSKEIKARLNQT
ncbi:CYFIP-related Rac1 interactor B-like [Corticium candelabrum]|uniref:CYFIP-related Rac1 interactor B-like n=1 Tax=Corticium candelabrum TaxID=121492 RepID=UPI002E254AAB|nr:CYFIP-related Rac1 interactor B-like [Corticium candelabrum]